MLPPAPQSYLLAATEGSRCIPGQAGGVVGSAVIGTVIFLGGGPDNCISSTIRK